MAFKGTERRSARQIAEEAKLPRELLPASDVAPAAFFAQPEVTPPGELPPLKWGAPDVEGLVAELDRVPRWQFQEQVRALPYDGRFANGCFYPRRILLAVYSPATIPT